MPLTAPGLADLRSEAVYPYGPMPALDRQAWDDLCPDVRPTRWERQERERRELEARTRRALQELPGSGLVSWDRPAGLGTPTGSVARVVRETLDALAARSQEELRRKRHQMRAASQELVTVDVREAEARTWYRLNEDTQELEKIAGAPKLVRHRLGLKLCGRVVGVDLPGKGEKQAGRRLDRAAAVQVVQQDGKASLRGVHRCGNVWSCPTCAYHIATRRGEELQTVFDSFAEEGAAAYLVTLTVRHSPWMELEPMRRAVANVWRQVRQLRRFRQLLEELGYLGDVRALEVTHGGQGWHPHLHLLAWFRAPLTQAQGDALSSVIFDAWADRIVCEAGPDARPDRAHGVVIDRVTKRADYVAKLGVAAELTSAHGKDGRRGNRTPWKILRDWVERRRDQDARLWVEWTEGIHGARQLTWSGAELKARRAQLLGDELEDADLAATEGEGGELVAEIPRRTWELCERALPAFAVWVLEAAERFGGRGLVELVRELETEILGNGRPPPWWRGWSSLPPPGGRPNATV